MIKIDFYPRLNLILCRAKQLEIRVLYLLYVKLVLLINTMNDLEWYHVHTPEYANSIMSVSSSSAISQSQWMQKI